PVLPEPDDEHLAGRADRRRDRVDVCRGIDQPGLLLRARFRVPQALRQRRVGIVVRGFRRAVAVAAVAARQRLADRVLQIGIALEAQLLAELDDAGLADLEGVGELLGGIVA